MKLKGRIAYLPEKFEPPPFLWFHRDIFAARPDVDAIVHTHQINARAVALSSESFGPVIRAGARYANASVVYDVPDLMFDEVHRRRAVTPNWLRGCAPLPGRADRRSAAGVARARIR